MQNLGIHHVKWPQPSPSQPKKERRCASEINSINSMQWNSSRLLLHWVTHFDIGCTVAIALICIDLRLQPSVHFYSDAMQIFIDGFTLDRIDCHRFMNCLSKADRHWKIITNVSQTNDFYYLNYCRSCHFVSSICMDTCANEFCKLKIISDLFKNNDDFEFVVIVFNSFQLHLEDGVN